MAGIVCTETIRPQSDTENVDPSMAFEAWIKDYRVAVRTWAFKSEHGTRTLTNKYQDITMDTLTTGL